MNEFEAYLKEISKRIVGMREVSECMFISLVCKGHILLEGPPGVAKTTLAKTFAEIIDASFKRVQFTPDLLPSDIIGTVIFDPKMGNFYFRKGPIFTNILLADEINRAPPKTQSALLEAMEERQVTVEGKTYKLDEPFMVIATQNPIEQEGSLPLDEEVLINGNFKAGRELLSEGKLVFEKNGIRVYKIEGKTLSLDTEGDVVEMPCFLYVMKYKGKVLEIETETGRKIKVTENHPLLVNDKGKILWKNAYEIKEGDYLVSVRKIPKIKTKVPSHEEVIRKIKPKRSFNKIDIDDDFGFWVAFILAEGTIGEKHIEVCQKEFQDAVDRFVEISKKYGFSPKVYEKNGVKYVRIYSKYLVEYLKERFKIDKRKIIPKEFIFFPEDFLKEFLKAFISFEGNIWKNRITVTQRRRENLETLFCMLLRFGILSRIYDCKRVCRLRIQGKYFKEFMEKIGWLKKVNIAKNIGISYFDGIPVDPNILKRLLEILGIRKNFKGKSITKRDWFGSYRGVAYDGEVIMNKDYLQRLRKDVEKELSFRKSVEFLKLLDENPLEFARKIGVSSKEISEAIESSLNKVWMAYITNTSFKEMREFLLREYERRILEAELLLRYLKRISKEEIFYEKIVKIREFDYYGDVFGLIVPFYHNYLAFGPGIHHNTYPLPEAQLDRFLFKVDVNYPSKNEERIILKLKEKEEIINKIFSKDDIERMRQKIDEVFVSDEIMEYIVSIVDALRNRNEVVWGPSPRATISLLKVSKACAMLSGRDYVLPKDVKKYAIYILHHRIGIKPEYETEGITKDDIVREVLREVDAP